MKRCLILLMIVTLAGCSNSRSRWPWEDEKTVPVTPAAATGPERPANPPATQPADVPAEAVVVTAVEPTTVRQSSPQAQPAAVAVAEPADEPTTRPTTQPAVAVSPVETVAASPPETQPAQPAVAARPDDGVVETEVVETAVFEVNNQIITVDDLLVGMHGELKSVPTNVTEESYRAEVKSMIQKEIPRRMEEAMVLAEAKNHLDERQKKIIDDEMNETLREMVVQAGGSRNRLERDLRDVGLTLEGVLKNQRQRVTVYIYMNTLLMPAVHVNRKMLWDYYQQHAEEFSEPKKVQMQIIAEPFDAFLPAGRGYPTDLEIYSAKKAAREKIIAAAKALQDGEDFTKVAKELSKGYMAWAGDDAPLLPRGSFKETKVEEAAFALDEGQMRGVIETDDGYFIVKATRVIPGKKKSFEDAQEQIGNFLRARQLARLRSDYFRRLLAGTTISPSQEFVEQATDRAVERYYKKK